MMYKKDTPLEKVITAFKNDYQKGVSNGQMEYRLSELSEGEQKEYWRRDGELHPSNFPFCGLRSAFDRMHREEDPIITQDFGSTYFLSVGTETHSALQRWFGYTKRLIGDWKCKKCGSIHTFRNLPSKCKKCRHKEFLYEELGGHHGKHISWHTDGVYKHFDGTYWLHDWKTTSSYAVEKHRKLIKDGEKGTFPYVANRFQIESYIVLVEKKYKIKISGWLLIYVPRDNPKYVWGLEVVGGIVSSERKEELKNKVAQADRDFGITLKVKDKPTAVLAEMRKTKLCCDKEFYTDYVYSQFDECPLAKRCFSKSQLTAKLEKEVKIYRNMKGRS